MAMEQVADVRVELDGHGRLWLHETGGYVVGLTPAVEGSLMNDDVAAYIDAIDADHRPLFDRVHRLVMEVQPEPRVVLAYKMPTYVAGTRQLHVGVWKHGLSFYGWKQDQDGGLVARHPHLDSGKGTLRLPLTEAVHVSDDELRAFVAAALAE